MSLVDGLAIEWAVEPGPAGHTLRATLPLRVASPAMSRDADDGGHDSTLVAR